jgi:hypothetical protein
MFGPLKKYIFASFSAMRTAFNTFPFKVSINAFTPLSSLQALSLPSRLLNPNP